MTISLALRKRLDNAALACHEPYPDSNQACIWAMRYGEIRMTLHLLVGEVRAELAAQERAEAAQDSAEAADWAARRAAAAAAANALAERDRGGDFD